MKKKDCINCPHVIVNIEEYDDGTFCTWYECDKTGSVIQEENKCPLEMSAQEAINLLKSKLDGKTDTSWEWTEAIRQAIEAIKETEWVPIEIQTTPEEDGQEHSPKLTCRLPEDGEEVLVSTIYRKGVSVDTFINDGEEGCYFENYDWDEIIAWRHLPKPYAGGEE